MGIDEAIAALTARSSSSLPAVNHQMRVDEFSTKAGPYAHQDLIAGYTVAKVYWLKKNTRRYSLDETPELIYDEAGGSRSTSRTRSTSSRRTSSSATTRHSRCATCATSSTRSRRPRIEKAPWVIDRTYVTYETLERMEKLGIYKNVKYVKETRTTTRTTRHRMS
jgi:hypothetical protein